MYCRQCGKWLDDNDRFCSVCGTPVAAEGFVPAFKKEVQPAEKPAPKLVPFDEPKEEKPRTVIHHDEFDWNLEGFPDEQKKTDDVDFQWESILGKRNTFDEEFIGFKTPDLEEKIKEVAPVVIEKKELPKEEVVEETPAEEPAEVQEEALDIPAEAPAEEESDDEQTLEEFLFEEKKPQQLSDTIVVLRKSGEEKVDKFYTFNKKNAEFQALLDQEFARLRKAQEERHSYVPEEPAESPKIVEEAPAEVVAEVPEVEEAPVPAETPAEEPEEALAPAETPVEEPEAAPAPAETPAEEPEEAPAPAETPAEEPEAAPTPAETPAEEPAAPTPVEAQEQKPAETAKELTPSEEAVLRLAADEEKATECVGVVLASTPAGIMVELEKTDEEPAEDAAAPVNAEEPAEPETEKPAEEKPAAEETAADTSEKVLPPSEEEKDQSKESGQKLTFDDVFSDDDEDDSKSGKKGSAFLKFIAFLLCILVIAELAMIGIQYFAPDSQAAEYINQGYSKVLSMIKGEEQAVTPADAVEGNQDVDDTNVIPELINQNADKNTNIGKVKYSSDVTFDDGEDYGYENFSKTYAFTDNPWYTDDEGNSVTYGNEIIGTVIGYYNGWLDQMNGKDSDMLEYIEQTAEIYSSMADITGEEGTVYGINTLEIGEIRTSGAGFYVRTRFDLVNSESDEAETQTQVIYIEPFSKAMKIVDIKDL